MRKGLHVILMVVLLVATLNISTQAEQYESSIPSITMESISPKFSNIILFQNSFDISISGNSSISSNLYAQSCDQIVIVANLQQLNNGTWMTIKSWSNATYGTSAILSGSYFITSSKYYRVVTTGTIYRAGILIEQDTNTSAAKYY